MESDSAKGAADAAHAPRVLAAVALGLKGALMESGVWEQVRVRMEREAPTLLKLFDTTDANGWVLLEAHVKVVDVATELIGVDAMRDLGRARILGMQLGALFPNMVRSWTRTFAEDPKQVVQVGPHLWRAGTDNCGTLSLISYVGHDAVFRFEHAPLMMRSSAGWRAMLEGVALGVLSLAGLDAEVHLLPPEPGTDFADATVHWEKKA